MVFAASFRFEKISAVTPAATQARILRASRPKRQWQSEILDQVSFSSPEINRYYPGPVWLSEIGAGRFHG